MKKHNIYGGSKLKVSSKCDFYTSPSIGYGVALRLRAVQVLEYVEGSSNGNKFGFDQEEGFTLGEEFTAEAEAAPETVTQEPVAVAVAEVPKPAPTKVVEAPKPAPKVAEEPAPAPAVNGAANDLAAEIADLIGSADD